MFRICSNLLNESIGINIMVPTLPYRQSDSAKENKDMENDRHEAKKLDQLTAIIGPENLRPKKAKPLRHLKAEARYDIRKDGEFTWEIFDTTTDRTVVIDGNRYRNLPLDSADVMVDLMNSEGIEPDEEPLHCVSFGRGMKQ
jgi:hypothetical protein